MEYPLIIQGEKQGALSVERDGLYTRMEAWTETGGQLRRIWVHGGGRAGYLGVLQPWSGGMYLRRRLSRRELEAFPESIEYASDEPGAGESSAIPQARPQDPEPAPAAEAEEAIPDEELLWLRRPDGSLTAFNGHCSLLALPAELRRGGEGTVLRRINGREYMVFRY